MEISQMQLCNTLLREMQASDMTNEMLALTGIGILVAQNRIWLVHVRRGAEPLALRWGESVRGADAPQGWHRIVLGKGTNMSW